LEPVTARQTWRTLEPLHGMIYFAGEADAAYTAVGLDPGPMGYFASRSAAMGAVGSEVVIATFFNFNPALVRSVIPAAWRRASPEAVLAARLEAADAALRRALGDAVTGPDMAEAARLVRTAAEAACGRPQGRALFAAHAQLPWPEPDHLVLWHGQSLLREFRGDGHVGLLLGEDLGPVEALVLHAASGEVGASALRASRQWSSAEWQAGVDALRARGWVAADGDLALTDEGRSVRQRIEDRTDLLALAPYEAIGEDGCRRLRQLARPWSKAVVEGGLLSS